MPKDTPTVLVVKTPLDTYNEALDELDAAVGLVEGAKQEIFDLAPEIRYPILEQIKNQLREKQTRLMERIRKI